MHISIYTDGGCEPNPGKGAWAFVVLANGKRIHEESCYSPHTTNNQMELTAILNAMRYCKERGIATAVLHSDSQYSINSIGVWGDDWDRKGIIHTKKNSDLIIECRELQKETKTHLKWVRGHNGNKWNEYTDNLCNKTMSLKKMRKEQNIRKADTFLETLRQWLRNIDEYEPSELELVEDFAMYLDSHFDEELNELL